MLKKRLQKMNKLLEKRLKWFEDHARKMGLDFFPINFEVVPNEVMLEVMSYGLPTRARHWSYGQSYEYQKIYGEMGLSKVYEIVLNNDPSYAFLLDTNSDIANTMVIAHVIGHVHFFKNNFLFKKTDRKMVYHAAERAQRIDNYITKHGIEAVERIMDIGFSMDKNIDWHKGVHRELYPPRKKILRKRIQSEFDDLLGIDSPVYSEVVVNNEFPPRPEKDFLWFLMNYASSLEIWEKDILNIIREESFYFYPAYYTKIMNEGFASYIHAELMYLIDDEEVHSHEYIEFCKIHERVVQAGGDPLNINPYFLGFTIFNDIKKRWDESHAAGNSDIDGFQKILEVVAEEDDISFLRNYLTQEIVDELGMFAYITGQDKSGEYIQIESREAADVVEFLISKIINYRTPVISIAKASSEGLELVHESKDIGTLDPKHLDKVMGYLHDVWGGIIDLETVDEEHKIIHYTYDEVGFSDNSYDE